MAKKKKKAKIPSTLEILKSIRVQIETPKGGFWIDETKYDRKDNKKAIQEQDGF